MMPGGCGRVQVNDACWVGAELSYRSENGQERGRVAAAEASSEDVVPLYTEHEACMKRTEAYAPNQRHTRQPQPRP